MLCNGFLLAFIDLIGNLDILSNIGQLRIWQRCRPLRWARIQINEPGTLLFRDRDAISFSAGKQRCRNMTSRMQQFLNEHRIVDMPQLHPKLVCQKRPVKFQVMSNPEDCITMQELLQCLSPCLLIGRIGVIVAAKINDGHLPGVPKASCNHLFVRGSKPVVSRSSTSWWAGVSFHCASNAMISCTEVRGDTIGAVGVVVTATGDVLPNGSWQ